MQFNAIISKERTGANRNASLILDQGSGVSRMTLSDFQNRNINSWNTFTQQNQNTLPSINPFSFNPLSSPTSAIRNPIIFGNDIGRIIFIDQNDAVELNTLLKAGVREVALADDRTLTLNPNDTLVIADENMRGQLALEETTNNILRRAGNDLVLNDLKRVSLGDGELFSIDTGNIQLINIRNVTGTSTGGTEAGEGSPPSAMVLPKNIVEIDCDNAFSFSIPAKSRTVVNKVNCEYTRLRLEDPTPPAGHLYTVDKDDCQVVPACPRHCRKYKCKHKELASCKGDECEYREECRVQECAVYKEGSEEECKYGKFRITVPVDLDGRVYERIERIRADDGFIFIKVDEATASNLILVFERDCDYFDRIDVSVNPHP